MTPIADFVKSYAQSGMVRMHMPGHKGAAMLGIEERDITEIQGAGYLYGGDDIISRSEEQTARVFQSGRTLYSTEGSTLCIKTMLGLVKKCRCAGGRMRVMAPRNVHKAFIDGCILLDIDVSWVYPQRPARSVCSSQIGRSDIVRAMEKEGVPDCVYVTSPDYLGNMADIRELAGLCRERGIPLLVDNAHGAYLGLLEESLHPLALGAAMCCDSAHKTLPCLTGGAYLHISKEHLETYGARAKQVMSMFASTSPSYLILQSLDLCGERLCAGFRQELKEAVRLTAHTRKTLEAMGWRLTGDEPCKLTVDAAMSGLTGDELGDELRKRGIEPEYTDGAYLVMMPSVDTTEQEHTAVIEAMSAIPRHPEHRLDPPVLKRPVKRMGLREAYFSPSESVPLDRAVGRICAAPLTGCQPSVPVIVPGEEIDPDCAKLLRYCGIESAETVILPDGR